MAKNSDRQWLMLRMVPRAPQKISVQEIMKRLRVAGFNTSIRSIQRDLNALSERFALIGDDAKPQGWSFAKDSPAQILPSIDNSAKLVGAVAREHLLQILPFTSLQKLKPLFDAMDFRDDHVKAVPLEVKQIVQVRSRHLIRLAPRIDPGIQDELGEALIEGKQLEILYQRLKDSEPETYQVHPLGLLIVDNVSYLAVTIEPYSDVRHLAVHRLRQVKKIPFSARRPPGFDLAAHVDFGALQIKQSADMLPLKFRMKTSWINHIEESRLSADQCIQRIDGQWSEVSASMADSAQLRWWLRGYGADIEVIAPTWLRKEFENTSKAMAKLYGSRKLDAKVREDV